MVAREASLRTVKTGIKKDYGYPRTVHDANQLFDVRYMLPSNIGQIARTCWLL